MWHEVKRAWNSDSASDMYSGPLRAALAKTFPRRAAKRNASWLVMEDNDPSGYKSGKAVKTKRRLRMRTMKVPKRSPDLNVLDYRLWADITRRMRQQERSWPASKTESRDAYKARLRRTALRTSPTFVKKAVQDMKRRCKLLVQAKGWYFEESKK